ncbi:MAG: hypothetical protein ACI8RZ_006500, partial [Myxococcota bacterium]
MNRIQMYASSTHLKLGLHRVLAVSHALTTPVVPGDSRAWWSMLAANEQERAQEHRLPLDVLADIYGRPTIQASLNAARVSLGLDALDFAAVSKAFRVAIISGRAHRAHMGRDVYGSSNKGLWDLVCGDFGQAVAERYGTTLGDDPRALTGSQPSQAAIAVLQTLTAFDTSPAGADHLACVAWLTERLRTMGFAIEVLGRELGQPLLIAHREARGLAGHVVLYGHYDVTPFGREQRWTHPPREL